VIAPLGAKPPRAGIPKDVKHMNNDVDQAGGPETPRRNWAHVCERCGAGAGFGFTDRHDVSRWFCAAHRAEGRRLLPRRDQPEGHGPVRTRKTQNR
jgi:hypothetical protein